MSDDAAELNRLSVSLAAQLSSARERLDLARRALLATGYFTEAQVGPDIAPRITEYASATDALLDVARAERDAERAKVQAVEAAASGMFIEDDGWDVPCLWQPNGDYPVALVRVIDVPGSVWALIRAALAAAQPTGKTP